MSIVVAAYGRWPYTNACLRALARTLDGVPVEVIVVDDASTDRTAEMLAGCAGVRVVRRERNGGFVAAANDGAAAARGTFVHFLNNDTIVAPGWLQPLLDAFETGGRVAAVASQLRYPDDTLAEAGAILWNDGRGTNYGRGESPGDWRFLSLREIDYGSAASLMVRAADFAAAGGFSLEFAPAYYEDADLCFSLRARGGRVVYQPRSIVYHAEGASYASNRDAAARALQERHRERFARKWRAALDAHFAPDPALAEAAARRLAGAPTVLLVDEHVPFDDRDAGSRRTRAILDLLRRRGCHTIFGSEDRTAYEPYTSRLREAGIETIAGFDAGAIARLNALGLRVDLAWLARPGIAQRLLPLCRRDLHCRVLFDTVDLHYVRLHRQASLTGRRTHWEAMRRRELAVAAAADLTLVTSALEAEILRAEGVSAIEVLSIVEPRANHDAPGWEARSGVVFLGNFAHAPNVDAARWLCTAVMPLVWRALPQVRLTLAGADPPRAVRALASPKIEVPGFVPDAAALLARSRVFAAPLRFGAGVKGKIVYALAHGIPVVTTPIGAEGIFTASDDAAVEETAQRLAESIVDLYGDRAAWERHARAGDEIARRFEPARAAEAIDRALRRLELLQAGEERFELPPNGLGRKRP